jgi:hypothetical protein
MATYARKTSVPYLPPSIKQRLDPHIDSLAAEIAAIAAEESSETAFAGSLNYACTRLAVKTMPERRYWAIATVVGVMKNVADEFYRRVAVPYEEERRIEHGDVFDP